MRYALTAWDEIGKISKWKRRFRAKPDKSDVLDSGEGAKMFSLVNYWIERKDNGPEAMEKMSERKYRINLHPTRPSTWA